MCRFLIALCAGLLAASAAARASDDDWTIASNSRAIVMLAKCGSTLNSAVVVQYPAYAIGAEALESWFAKQIAAHVIAWSGSYPKAQPAVRPVGAHLEADVDMKVNGQTWRGRFFAKASAGRASWSAVIAPSIATLIAGPYSEARDGLREYFETADMLTPESLEVTPRQPSSAVNAGAMIGYLRSSSAKWITNGSLTNGERRYVLLDSGGAYELVPSTGSRVANGTWSRSGDSYQVLWNDGSAEIVPQACFTAQAEPTSGGEVESAPGAETTGQNCHTEERLVTTSKSHFSCFPAPCGMKFGPVSEYQYVQVCD